MTANESKCLLFLVMCTILDGSVEKSMYVCQQRHKEFSSGLHVYVAVGTCTRANVTYSSPYTKYENTNLKMLMVLSDTQDQ